MLNNDNRARGRVSRMETRPAFDKEADGHTLERYTAVPSGSRKTASPTANHRIDFPTFPMLYFRSTKYIVQSTKMQAQRKETAGRMRRAKTKDSAITIDYDRIKQLISLVEDEGLAELSVEKEGFGVTIKAEREADPIAVPTAAGHAPAQPPEAELPAKHLFQITSPMVGVFYRRPSPDAPPYVEVGDEIEDGQPVGLIEAMKVFSEIPSEVAGRVVAIPAESAKLVQAGDVLVVVDTSPSE